MALEYSLVELDLIRVVVRAGKCSKAGGGQRNNGCKWQCMQERDHVWPPDSRLGKEGKISRDGEQWEGDRVNKLVISVRWKDCAAICLPPSLPGTDRCSHAFSRPMFQPTTPLFTVTCVCVCWIIPSSIQVWCLFSNLIEKAFFCSYFLCHATVPCFCFSLRQNSYKEPPILSISTSPPSTLANQAFLSTTPPKPPSSWSPMMSAELKPIVCLPHTWPHKG